MNQALTRTLRKLKQDKSNPWPAESLGAAPHKPLFLLALCSLAETGCLVSAALPLKSDLAGELAETYAELWQVVLPGRTPVLHLPTWHLRSDGLWSLHDLQGQQVPKGGSVKSWSEVTRKAAIGQLNEELFAAISDPEGRGEVIKLLLTTYFATGAGASLQAALTTLREGVRYGQLLIEATRAGEPLVTFDTAPELPAPVRDAGFRRAVREAYDHRCSTCGLRIRTADQRSLVQAAHIRPWAESHDDRPVNGLAMCPTCHWCFDQYLLRIHPTKLVIRHAAALGEGGNIPAHLQSLEGRPIFPASEDLFGPDPDSLQWRWKQSA